MDPSIESCQGLSESDVQFLQQVEDGLSIAADVSRADLLLYGRQGPRAAVVIAQAQPHSISTLFPASELGKVIQQVDDPLVLRALYDGQPGHRQRMVKTGAPVIEEVYPVHNQQGKVIAALGIETTLIERERHRRRSRVFQSALSCLQKMAAYGDLRGARSLGAFGEWDGIVVADSQRRITYLSGIATHLYRHLNYLEDLRGKRLGDLQTRDDEVAATALRTMLCQRWEGEEQSRYWSRQVIPLVRYTPYWPLPAVVCSYFPQHPDYRHESGVLILVHDDTEPRRKQQELNVQRAMVQEVHHRVKNNLQNIAALLRLQARRCKAEETRQELDEAVNRILSVAVIHDYLAHDKGRHINIREVFQRIITQTEQMALAPGRRIHFELKGPSIYLHKDQATACALVFNELLFNALEHGFDDQQEGSIHVELTNIADRVSVRIVDDGSGLPEGFSLDQARSLGLQIVQTLVRDDLKGAFALYQQDGVVAEVSFPKMPLGGS
jgi:two-component sensor histidine kinase